MSILRGDSLTQLAFALFENRGVFAVLLGSGVSRSAAIPTGWEITLDLVRRLATAQGHEGPCDWAEWYRLRTGKEPNYSELLEDLTTYPDERRSILHRYIEPTEDDRAEGRKLPTKAHHAIARLVRDGYVRVIITTNFDRLMENALREAGVEPTVIATEDALQGAEPFCHSQCYLLKLHGDYKDARILNTDQELSTYPAPFNGLLDRIFDEHGLVICGWSGEWDHALRSAILRAPNRRYPLYWATRGALAPRGAELAEHRKAKVFAIGAADEFFPAVQQIVETVEQSQQRSPLTLDVLVQSAKRYLSKPQYRIQLDDLFAQEGEKLLTAASTEDFKVEGVWSDLEFRERVARYEALSEPLSRIAGVLGRWGDGTDVGVMLELLRSLHAHANQPASGLVIWSNLRAYPAVLIFCAYGVGLTKARRWKELQEFLSSTQILEDREPARMVSALHHNAWRGADKQAWQMLDGLDKHKTPLSDHLCDLMRSWGSSFVGLEPRFDLLFERFEMLASLAVFQQNDEGEMQAASTALSKASREFVWMPMGRAGWHSEGASILLRELDDRPYQTSLLDAGFANGNADMLRLFADNFRRLARRLSW